MPLRKSCQIPLQHVNGPVKENVQVHVIILVKVPIKGCAPLVHINVKELAIIRVREQVNVLRAQIVAKVAVIHLALARVNPQQKI